MKNKVLKVILGIVFIPVFAALCLAAPTLYQCFLGYMHPTVEKTVSLQDTKFEKAALIQDFFHTAFSNAVFLNDDAFAGRQFINSYMNDDRFYSPLLRWLGTFPDSYQVPWLRDYMDRAGAQLPALDRVNKWDGDITIGFDWPAYSSYCNKRPTAEPCTNPYSIYAKPVSPIAKTALPSKNTAKKFDPSDPVYLAVKAQITSLIPDMQKFTGLRVRFIEPGSDEERGRNFAKIRIVPIENTHQKNNYFKAFHFPGGHGTDGHWSLTGGGESRLVGAVPYTPTTTAQLSGYLLTDADNHIGMSVCEILPAVGEKLIRSLVTECLVRSLGFPEVLPTNAKMALAHWNIAHETAPAAPQDFKEFHELDAFNTEEMNKNFPSKLTDEKNLPIDFTPEEKLLVSMLYCPAIKPGMDKFKALSAFSLNPGCFQ